MQFSSAVWLCSKNAHLFVGIVILFGILDQSDDEMSHLLDILRKMHGSN